MLELAQAAMARQIFPQATLKYMPPTKHMTGDIFAGYLLNGMFNLTGALTGQGIQLLGMLTEALHTPFLHDRFLALENARYVMRAARHLGDEIVFQPGGRMEQRADQVLSQALEMLQHVAQIGLMAAIEQGQFADVKRSRLGGKGLDGVARKDPDYYNPFLQPLREASIAPAAGLQDESAAAAQPEPIEVQAAPPVKPATVDYADVRPYGDTLDDGCMQLSFTLPVPIGPQAQEAAKQLLQQLGLQAVSIVHLADMGEGFTFIVAYAQCPVSVDYAAIHVPQVTTAAMDLASTDKYIAAQIGRPLVVVGACTGSDAHTVGLDAIMNMKGFAGEPGLERYSMLQTYNLGSQVPNEELVAKARQVNADVILISQVVTQKDIHIANMAQLVELLEAENMRRQVLLICGGPRLSHELAIELGYDAGFGPGTMPSQVASFIAQAMAQRLTGA